jgi:DNA-binding MarR family transcriptional regulator
VLGGDLSALRENASMKSKTAPPTDLTPLGRLHEGALAGIVGYRLAQATVSTNQVFSAVMAQNFELRQVEFTVLALIQANPELTASDLAKALAVTPPNITMWLDRLEGRGLVERVRSTADRRAQHVRATESGAAAAQRAAALLVDAEREALAVLSAAEQAILVELLNKVARCRRPLDASRRRSEANAEEGG